MNVKKAMPLVLAVVLGLVAMVMARKMLKPPVPHVAPANTTPVVVATRDVAPGRALTAEDLAVADIPTSLVPSKAFNKVSDLVERIVTTPLVHGQAILEPLLAPEGAGAGISALVPDGYRAMTMSIDDVTGIGGMIVPGCRVDLNVMVPDERTKQQTSRTVLQNLKIIAVGKQLTAGTGDAPPGTPSSSNVTFLVTPDQARVLELAASTARPWLALRSFRDNAPLTNDRTLISVMHGMSYADANAQNESMAQATTRPAAPEATTKPSANNNFVVVEVIRGNQTSQVTVPMPASLGGHGLPIRGGQTAPSPENTREAEKSDNAGKAAMVQQGAQPILPLRPTAEIDRSDAFKSSPFGDSGK